MEHSVKEHALYLKAALEYKYKVTTDWEGNFYIGISLQWDHEKGTFQISMTVYVRASLHLFKHEKPKVPQASPYPWTQSIYEKNNQILNEKKTAEELDENNQKRLHNTVGKLLYYARSIDPTILMALNSLAAAHTKPRI